MVNASKRIAFMIAQQSLIIAGGIGQFAKAFIEMSSYNGWEVDLILDGLTSDNTKAMLETLKKSGWSGKLYHNIDKISYRDFQATLENMHKDGINFEKEINFRQAMFRALQDGREYDLILCNNPEALLPVYSMGLASKISTILYTHNENFVGIEDKVGPYSQEYNDVYKRLMDLPDVIVATQTLANVKRMRETLGIEAIHLPMPIPEQELLVPYERKTDIREGVLFIGRWEDRKDYKEYLKVIQETGLVPRVMTNESGGRKFSEAFQTLGIKKFRLGINLVGLEKVDFIRDSSVFFNPSKKESFGYSVLECMPHCHVVLCLEYEWSKDFEHLPNVYRVPKKQCADKVKSLHGLLPNMEGITALSNYQDSALCGWAEFMATRLQVTKTIPQLRKQEAIGVDALF